MSDEQGGGGQPQGEPGGGDTGQQQPPEWMAGLSDDLKTDATLSRYKSLDDFAKGHLETKRVASSKLVVPGADADQSAWDNFFGQLGRPAEASAYEVPTVEGVDATYVDAFKGKAHALGLLPKQVAELAAWQNEQVTASIAAANDASAAELTAFKAATPDFEAKLVQAQALLKATGVDEATLTELDLKLGTKATLQFVFGLAEKFGEAQRVDPENPVPPRMDGDTTDAARQLRELNGDAGWRDKIKAGDAGAIAQRARLLAAANAQANKPA